MFSTDALYTSANLHVFDLHPLLRPDLLLILLPAFYLATLRYPEVYPADKS